MRTKNKEVTVNSLYNDCYILSCQIRRLDKTSEEYKSQKFFLMQKLSKQSENLFQLMANYLNGHSDLTPLNINPIILPNLFYMFLYSIYYVNIDCRGYFEDDGRSEGTYNLAKVMLVDEHFIDNFARKDSWLGNTELMNKGISNGVRRIHKTLIQNTTRALLNQIRNNYDMVIASATKKEKPFIDILLQYTFEERNGKHIYIPYV